MNRDLVNAIQKATLDALTRAERQIPWRKRFVAWLRRFPR